MSDGLVAAAKLATAFRLCLRIKGEVLYEVKAAAFTLLGGPIRFHLVTLIGQRECCGFVQLENVQAFSGLDSAEARRHMRCLSICPSCGVDALDEREAP